MKQKVSICLKKQNENALNAKSNIAKCLTFLLLTLFSFYYFFYMLKIQVVIEISQSFQMFAVGAWRVFTTPMAWLIDLYINDIQAA